MGGLILAGRKRTQDMGWKDLLQQPDESITVPWTGGRVLRVGPRTWKLQGRLPVEFGWYRFKVDGRKARLEGQADPDTDNLIDPLQGYLVGDRIVPDGARVNPDPATIVHYSERVYLLEEGLDRFVRIKAARPFEGGPLVYVEQEMPLGPEDAVLGAYLDEKPSVADVPEVVPALDAAFRMETWHRSEARRIREEEERRRREEEERLAREQRRQELAERLGDAAGRRAMAQEDFGEAARASLAVGGAVYLDHRPARQGEMAVRFRFLGRRFECTCDPCTLRIIDSGICLTDHGTGVRGDTRFTLESLPAVIHEADRDDLLVVYRHV